jgi:hypothetical protein
MKERGPAIRLHPADRVFLEARGAISAPGPKETFSRSAVLHRELRHLRAVLERYDPRRTSGMPEEMYQLAARLIPEPWAIRDAGIENLAFRLREAPDFAARAQAAGIDPAALVATIDALGFAEKLALLDAALREQAPAASMASEARMAELP